MANNKNNKSQEKTRWFNADEWTFRNNKTRKKGDSDKGSHPALVVGKKGKKMANIGLSTKPKRGHHKNIELHSNPNPKDNRKAYLRNDLQFHDEKMLKEILKKYKLSPKDIEKVKNIIKKSNQK